jgi:hypothetical protein
VELSRFLPWYQVLNIGVGSCKAFCVIQKIALLVGNYSWLKNFKKVNEIARYLLYKFSIE